jgi:hypothetical protein
MRFDKYFENLRLKFEKYDKFFLVNKVEDYKYSFLYISYAHFDNNEDDFDNILNSIIFNRTKSNIDSILLDTNHDNNDMIAYRFSYYQPNQSLDLDETKQIIVSISNTLNNMMRGIFDIKSQDIMHQFNSVNSELNKSSRIIIRVVTNIEANKKKKKENNKLLNENLKSFNLKHEWEILYADEVIDIIDEVDNPNQAIEIGEISIDDDDNIIQYNNNNIEAYLINVSARSIKQLYEINSSKLFGLNLRYYVKNDKVDKGIADTISQKKDKFWFMNNGIIIIADGADFNNNKVKLKNFSIINGGQTTKNIGEANFDEDFYLVCKLILSGKLTEEEKMNFISDVADATNSQKQILPKDLIANKVEQRELKKQLQLANIFLEVKRGENKPHFYKEKWQSIKNERLGQLLLSFMYQKPGFARNKKKDILNTKGQNYKLVFLSGIYKTELLTALIILNYIYESKYMSKKVTNLETMENIVVKRNSLMIAISLIGLIVKLINNEELKEELASVYRLNSIDEIIFILGKKDVNNLEFNRPVNDSEREIFFLFDHLIVIVKKALDSLNKINDKEGKENMMMHNFTKQDNNYHKYVIKELIQYSDYEVLINLVKKIFKV